MSPSDYQRLHIVYPLLLLFVVQSCLSGLSVDLWLADGLFKLEGGQWWFKDHWLFQLILHDGGRIVSGTMAFILLGCLAMAGIYSHYRIYFRALLITTLSVTVALGLVNVLKVVTDGSCPWDLQRYGGTLALSAASVFNSVQGGGHCFPAGHASGGYVWLVLYFLARVHAPRWRFIGLTVGMSMGLLFGLAQQFRGAHFLSHDLWTLAICWFIPAAGYNWFSRRPNGCPHSAGSAPSRPGTARLS